MPITATRLIAANYAITVAGSFPVRVETMDTDTVIIRESKLPSFAIGYGRRKLQNHVVGRDKRGRIANPLYTISSALSSSVDDEAATDSTSYIRTYEYLIIFPYSHTRVFIISSSRVSTGLPCFGRNNT